jgi:UDP-N-acetylglucosamine--N-acetylmuramyl-(pentapeptide) pyrophosphoryl-undecaprenol N-acetylglucosamine transferase
MKIWIATGGTGGHIFPALAVADELIARGNRVIVSSDGRGMKIIKGQKNKRAKGQEQNKMSIYPYDHLSFGIAFVWASGVGAKSKIKQAIALMKIGFSAIALTLRFMIFRPDRVVAFGGYSGVPVVMAARVWKIPTFLHEQNGHIGRANKFALRWINVLMTSFPKINGVPKTNAKIIYTGLPVRANFAPTDYQLASDGYRLLITGGSLGAQIMDEVCPPSIVALPVALKKKLFVVHQTRPENVVRLQEFYANNGVRANVLSFIHDMASELSAANLVVTRGGASTIVELQTIGRPAIIVPLAINPDQAANAENFAANGGGFNIEQDKFTQHWLTANRGELFSNPARLAKMSEKARVPNNAVENIVKEVTR